MARIHYWCGAVEGLGTYEFDAEYLLDIGDVVKDENGKEFRIADLAVDESVSCGELKMAQEDMMYV